MQRRAFRILSDRGPVRGGVTEARYVSLPAVCKTNEKVHYCVPNESIAEKIASFLGLPVAPGAIVELEEDDQKIFGYTGLQFGLTGEELPPIDPDECVARLPDLSAGLVLFDILIANPDRHTKNLSAVLHEQPYEMRIFDHSHALFGHSKNGALQRLKDLRDRLGVTGGSVTGQHRHCLLDKLDDATYFAKWQDRIASLPNHYIETICTELLDKGFINEVESSAITDFLRYRRDRFLKLIQDHQNEFKGIKQWPLPL
jgi:hypothetical protein